MYILVRCDCEDKITHTKFETMEDAQSELTRDLIYIIGKKRYETGDGFGFEWGFDNLSEAYAWDRSEQDHLVMWKILNI